MAYVVFLNGPPRSGKDTIGNALQQELIQQRPRIIDDIFVEKFAGSLKEAVADFLRLTHEEYVRFFETDEKDKVQESFFGHTPRSMLISFSEHWAKVVYGEDVFGRIFGRSLLKEIEEDFSYLLNSLTIVTDCGFSEELDGFFREGIDKTKCGLVRLHREGCDFKNLNDSRSYIYRDDLAFSVDIDNNGDINEPVGKIIQIIKEKLIKNE